MPETRIFPDAAALAQAAAAHFIESAAQAIAARGRFAVALAGGSTPRATYERIATCECARRVDWSRVHVFWGDERCVPPDHPDSNFRMARDALLAHVPLPEPNIHRIRGEADPATAAGEYEEALRKFFAQGIDSSGDTSSAVRLDLILLGMGDDGHTASLFPGTDAIHEQKRLVVAHFVEKLGAWRITLTPRAINAAASVAFIVAGRAKADRLRQVLTGPQDTHRLPAQVVRPAHGRVVWLVDRGAAAALQQD